MMCTCIISRHVSWAGEESKNFWRMITMWVVLFSLSNAFVVFERSSYGIWACFSLVRLPYARKNHHCFSLNIAFAWIPQSNFRSEEIRAQLSSRICGIGRENKPYTICTIGPPILMAVRACAFLLLQYYLGNGLFDYSSK